MKFLDTYHPAARNVLIPFPRPHFPLTPLDAKNYGVHLYGHRGDVMLPYVTAGFCHLSLLNQRDRAAMKAVADEIYKQLQTRLG